MSELHIYPVNPSVSASCHINPEQYRTLYQESIQQPDAFWARAAEQFLTWDRKWTQVREFDFHKGTATWFRDGKLNVTTNCIDRHLKERGDQAAFIWESDDPSQDAAVTYNELHLHVCRLANVLKQRGVKKGDRVCIYMPMIPEAAYAMLACARIGAIHSVVFGGFSPEALKDRLIDSDCKVLI